MRERILQILENYCNYLGGNENGDSVYGIEEDAFDDVVNDIQDLIDGELSDTDINYITDADDPYKDLPNEVFLEDEPYRPQAKFGLRYVSRR
jgi:hypothetical protein